MSVPVSDIRPRPFSVVYSIAVPLSFFVPDNSLTVNGYQVPIDHARDGFLETTSGTWWCVIRESGNQDIPFRATIMRESTKNSIAAEILYAFKVADIDSGTSPSDPASWHEYVYGEVTLWGVESFVRLAPFQLVRVRYSDSGSVRSDFKIYIPGDGTIQYNGMYVSFSGIIGKWYDVGRPATESFTVWCYLQDAGAGSIGPTATAHLTAGKVPSGSDIILSFPVCEYAPDNGGDSQADDDGSYSYDESSTEQEEVPLSAVAQADSLARDVDSPRLRPFGLYRPQGSTAYLLYLPPAALNIGSEKVFIEDVSSEGYKRISSVGKVYCVIYSRDEGEEVPTGYSAEFYAQIKTETGTPGEVYSFPVAEIKGNGEAQEFAYGSVVLSGLKPLRRLVPFEMVATGYRDEGRTKINYRMYTPPNGTIQYNGKFLSITEATGSWTTLEVGENTRKFFCSIDENGDAHILSDSSIFGKPGMKACFPVAELRLWGDWGWEQADMLVGEISAVVVGVRQSTVPGFDSNSYGFIGTKRFAAMLRAYTSDIVMLRNEAATVKAVKNAFERAAKSPGLSILYVSAHGYCDDAGNNVVGMYDALMTDAEVWEIAKTAKGKVFLVFDCCYAGSMWGPPNTFSMGQSLKRIASRDTSNVTLLCWSASTDSTVSWSNCWTGGFFTTAICRYASKNKTYSQIWDELEADEELMEWDVPEQTIIGEYWNSAKFLNLKD